MWMLTRIWGVPLPQHKPWCTQRDKRPYIYTQPDQNASLELMAFHITLVPLVWVAVD